MGKYQGDQEIPTKDYHTQQIPKVETAFPSSSTSSSTTTTITTTTNLIFYSKFLGQLKQMQYVEKIIPPNLEQRATKGDVMKNSGRSTSVICVD